MTQMIEKLNQLEKVWLIDLKKSDDNMSALHLAALNNHAQMLERLLQLDRLDANVKCWNNKTPLHFAVARLGYESCEILVRLGVERAPPRYIDLNLQDADGNTPLHDLMSAYTIANVWNACKTGTTQVK